MVDKETEESVFKEVRGAITEATYHMDQALGAAKSCHITGDDSVLSHVREAGSLRDGVINKIAVAVWKGEIHSQDLSMLTRELKDMFNSYDQLIVEALTQECACKGAR